MKMQRVRSLLVSTVLFTVASVASAGPGTTTTTTTTTSIPATTTTTTSTSVPGTTTTTSTTTSIPTTTTTSTTSTTSTTTTSTSIATTTTTSTSTTTSTTTTTTTSVPTSTTTTTLPPGDLTGERPFVDSKNSTRNTSLTNISLATNQFCFAGRVSGTDATVFPNRQVLFEYQSLGTVRRANTKKVDGEFGSVDLTLVIEERFSPPDSPNVLYTGTATSACSLKASLRKSGEQDRGRLRCDVGDDLAAFVPAAGFEALTPDQIESVQNAFPKRKNLKVKTRNGKVRFKTKGVPEPSGVDVDLSCDLVAP